MMRTRSSVIFLQFAYPSTPCDVRKITALKDIFRIYNLETFILWEEYLTTTQSLCNGEFEHRTGCFKSLNAPGFRGVAQGMLKYREIECIFMLLSNCHQFLSLCTERNNFYMAISLLLSFEVALTSVQCLRGFE